MATGLPIVATDVGGTSEVVSHGTTGLLVPPDDPKRLAEAILRIAQSPDQGREMGAAGRLRVEVGFDIHRMAQDYEDLYRRLMMGLLVSDADGHQWDRRR
jgi:glycosyltransferase involved in cell wall biosynthesis